MGPPSLWISFVGVTLVPDVGRTSLEPRRTSWCGDGLLDCDDGTCHSKAAIQRGVCSLGCPAAHRRCSDGSCLLLAFDCPLPLVKLSAMVASADVDLSLLSPPPVTVLAAEDGSVLASLQLPNRALGRTELRAHLSIGPVSPAEARAALPAIHRAGSFLRSPAFRIATTVGAEAEERTLEQPATLIVRADPWRGSSNGGHGEGTAGLCVARIDRAGLWRCVDRQLYAATPMILHSRNISTLGGVYAVVDQAVDAAPAPPSSPQARRVESPTSESDAPYTPLAVTSFAAAASFGSAAFGGAARGGAETGGPSVGHLSETRPS